jgi:hypothetical protein
MVAILDITYFFVLIKMANIFDANIVTNIRNGIFTISIGVEEPIR